jgi:hypothetical protein
MLGSRQADDAAESLDGRSDPGVVGCNHNRIDTARVGGATVDVLDHRAAGDVGERFSGKSRGGESGGDDSNSAKGRRSLERIEKPNRGHGE